MSNHKEEMKMDIKVLKRDGRTLEDFDTAKIRDAIYKAVLASHTQEEMDEFNDEIALHLANDVSFNLNPFLQEPLHINLNGTTSPDNNFKYVTVDIIQDMVERTLIKNGYADTAKEYILYRNKRDEIRRTRNSIADTIREVLLTDAKDSDVKRENGNIDGNTAMGTMLQIGSNVSKNFYLNNMISKDIAKSVMDGYIHIHDLDFYKLTVTCCQIDFKKLAKGGFNTGHGYLREPQSIAAYTTLAAIAIQSDQNDCHGGQSIPNFDYAMTDGIYKSFRKAWKRNVEKAIEFGLLDKDDFTLIITPKEDCKDDIFTDDFKYVRIRDIFENDKLIESVLGDKEDYRYYDKEKTGDCLDDQILKIIKMTKRDLERECYQAMEGFVHNLNTLHSRAGGQVPFSSINLGTDVSQAGRMVIKNLLLAMDAGLGHGETCIFPIVIFKLKEGVNYNPEDPNYDLYRLSLKVTGKRLFPNYIFLDAPFNLQYYKPGHPESEVAQMGCRTRVMGNVYDPSREIAYSRGNLSFTTINLPMLAIEANHDENKFYGLLVKYLDLAKKQLLERYEIQSHLKVKNLPFLMGQGIWLDSEKLGPEDEIGEVLKHGSLSIGFVGLAEALVALYGHHHGEGKEYWDKGYDIVKFMRNYTDKAAKDTKLNFSVLATPAEGLCGSALRKCRAKYGIIDGVTDKEYFTNSNHIPVGFNISAYEKIKLEAPFHDLCNAGHICYIEVDGDAANNVDALDAIVKCMHDEGVGYGAINHPVDRDPVCGYTGVINDTCPNCGRKETPDKPNFERIRRITGYLVGDVSKSFNDAKKAEEHDRVKHGLSKTE